MIVEVGRVEAVESVFLAPEECCVASMAKRSSSLLHDCISQHEKHVIGLAHR